MIKRYYVNEGGFPAEYVEGAFVLYADYEKEIKRLKTLVEYAFDAGVDYWSDEGQCNPPAPNWEQWKKENLEAHGE